MKKAEVGACASDSFAATPRTIPTWMAVASA